MSGIRPPKLPLKILKLYCSDEMLEELEGDLYEVYNYHIEERGVKYAKLFYWWLVMRSFRSFAFRNKKMKEKNRIGSALLFLKHNFTIARRNIVKHKTTSAINILGLAIGLGSFLAIFSIVQYELSFNTKIKDADQVYRIYSSFSGSFNSNNPGVPHPVSEYVKENFQGLESVAKLLTYSTTVKIPNKNEELESFGRQRDLIFVDSAYFEAIDQYEWVIGSPETSLNEPNKVVLTQNQASIYFGNEDWDQIIGKKVVYQDSLNVFVSGIVKQPASNTDFIFTDFISLPTVAGSWLLDSNYSPEWNSTQSSSQLFVKINKLANESTVLKQLVQLEEFTAKQADENSWVQAYKFQPLSDLHFNPEVGIFDHSDNSVHLQSLLILGVVALLILLIAIFNFINLETAQSTYKAKEVGVRKVMGSVRSQLVSRFITESLLIVFLSIVIAIPIAHYGIDYFHEFIPEGVQLEYSDPMFWLSLIIIGVGAGLLAGIYPAWIVSSFSPAKALKAGVGTPKGSLLRKSLILFQFLFSQMLIVGTLAMGWQISFMLDKELGFDEDGIMYFYTPWGDEISKTELIINELNKMPEVLNLAKQQTPPVQNGYNTTTVGLVDDKEDKKVSVHQKSGDTTFLKFYNIDLIVGRNLLPRDSTKEIIVNETFVNELGFSDPREALGKAVDYGENCTIVGVMKDFHFRSLHHPIEPLLYSYQANNRCIAMKVRMGDGLQTTVSKITDYWNEIYKEKPLTVYFMNETVERFYKAERQASELSSVATGIAIFISCLGLFGLISFTIIQKSKEMGIRKVLGASVLQIGSIISREFILLILIAFLIATPIAYFLIENWMNDFAYQATISWWIFVLGGGTSILIALITIGVKVWKASAANPIDSLKYE